MIDANYKNLINRIRFVIASEKLPLLRGIAAEWNKSEIILYFYNDGPIDEKLYEDYSCMATEVLAHFNEATIDERIIRWDKPRPLPDHQWWAFKDNNL